MDDITNRCIEKYFKGVDGVRFVPGLSGQKIGEDWTILIGDRAGPSKKFSNLAHEMCHLVEIDDARMLEYGWGLIFPEIWIFDRMCHNPVTIQMTERELRVFALQANLMESFGLEVDLLEMAMLCEWVPDSIMVPLENGIRPYSEEGTKLNLSLDEIKASCNRWKINQIQELRKTFTLDYFNNEWWRKIEWLKTEQPRLRELYPKE